MITEDTRTNEAEREPDDEPAASTPDASTPDAPEALPAGATCGVHEREEASFICDRCGTFGCDACGFARLERRSVCMACAQLGLGTPIPWERRAELGTWRAFRETVRLASWQPAAFFRTPTTQDSVLSAVAHGTLTFTVGLLLSYLAAGALVMLTGGTMAAISSGPDDGLEAAGTLFGAYGCFIAGMSPLALLFGPANALMGLVFSAAASHATLAMFKKTKGGFEDTLRAVAYANSPYVWSWVPLLGSFTWFWMVGLEVIAIRETHQCGTDWATAAALIYRLAFLALLIGTYVLFFAGFFLLAAPGRPG